MKRDPSKPTEAQTKKAVKDWLRAKKILYVQINQIRPVTNPKTRETYFIAIDAELRGAPDLIVFRKPVFRNHQGGMQILPAVACEIKSWRGTLSHDQIAWRERWLETGGIYLIVRKVEDIEEILGRNLKKSGNHVSVLTPFLVSFPTKHNWWDKRSDPSLVERSVQELGSMARNLPDLTFFMPIPGVGMGQLPHQMVWPFMKSLPDNVVVVVLSDSLLPQDNQIF